MAFSLLTIASARLLGVQAGLTGIIALALLAFGGSWAALSAVLGGMVASAGGVVYALAVWAFGGDEAKRAKRAAGALVAAEVLRIATTIGLLVAAFGLVENLAALPFLGAFVAALLAYGIVLLFG